MRRPPPVVSPAELAYYRAHFREALRDDAVVCLECGALFKELHNHLRPAHSLTADAYKEAWGYNRKTALITPTRHDALRQQALAQNLPASSPRDSIRRAQEANRRGTPPRRLQFRLDHGVRVRTRVAAGWRPVTPRKVDDDRLRSLVAEGLRFQDLLTRSGLGPTQVRARLRALGLMEPPRQSRLSESELLALCQAGRWPSHIAATRGVTRSNIMQRVRRLRRRGIPVPPPTDPRPNGQRRASDAQLLTLAVAGLKTSAIAARVGIRRDNVRRRLKVLEERGVLRAAQPKTAQRADATRVSVNAFASERNAPDRTRTGRLAAE